MLVLLIDYFSSLPLMLWLTPHLLLPLLSATDVFVRCSIKLIALMLHLLMLALVLLRLLLVAEEELRVGQGSLVLISLRLLLLVLFISEQKLTLILLMLLLLLVKDMRELVALRHGLIHLLLCGFLHGRCW